MFCKKNADICINYAINNVRVDSNLDFELNKSITKSTKNYDKHSKYITAGEKKYHCSDGNFNFIVFYSRICNLA
ncbi:hypothetical protein GCM10022422_13640 [Flavobacterium ginsengisoli]|uniref:Uncharacterized protein n=1 Tax=Flavobacterium ginsengisoli TaxID=871694 RepID=A0ABP7F6K5_9FLAO